MYRILREKGQSGERRCQAKAVPEQVATRPSQVFTWDMTKAAGAVKGVWYHAYVIICCIVGRAGSAVRTASCTRTAARR